MAMNIWWFAGAMFLVSVLITARAEHTGGYLAQASFMSACGGMVPVFFAVWYFSADLLIAQLATAAIAALLLIAAGSAARHPA